MFANALHEGGLDGYHAYVVGEVVESVAKGGVEAEEGKGRAVTLWIVSVCFHFLKLSTLSKKSKRIENRSHALVNLLVLLD